MSIAETLLDLHTRLSQKFDSEEQARFDAMFHQMGEKESRRLHQLCEADLTPENMVLIGLGHQYGKGVPRDDLQAVEWFKRSADLGNHVAMCHLGDCYRDGTGVESDHDLAIVWYQNAIATAPEARYAQALLDNLLWSRRIHQESIRRCCKLYEEAESDDTRRYYKRHIGTVASEDCQWTIFRSWYRLEKENKSQATEIQALKTQNEALKAQNEALMAQNDMLRTEIIYQPGGVGYREAQADFVGKASPPVPATLPQDRPP